MFNLFLKETSATLIRNAEPFIVFCRLKRSVFAEKPHIDENIYDIYSEGTSNSPSSSMHCVHFALPIILITIIGDELKLSVESRLKWGILQRYLLEAVFLGNNTSFYIAFR